TRAVVLRIDSRLENVEPVGRAVRAMCIGAGLPVRESGHVELALVEAVNNVIRHAYAGEPGHLGEIALTLGAEAFTLEISDDGRPMPRRAAPKLDFDPSDVAALPEGGMGLYLIHSVMDHVEFRRDGGRNRFVMRRRLAA